MASHGKVLDLFDDRYLELQDVVGNVEPLPTLVPYEQYKQHAITYRMDTNHDIFLALLQDFTERKALETGKELWTWCVQWEVDETAAAPHSPKKPRLDSGHLNTAQTSRSSAPPITAHARCIDAESLHQEDMVRILVDIVQVDSTVVPNFIEFLYRWIDFYEGDGKALKAALHGEIPSLWDFEYHPLLVSEETKRKMSEANSVTKHGDTDELAQHSPTKKTRQKPDLAALERKVEESERLKYREVHFGIQPPKLNNPLPPLINIPQDPYKRAKYYNACFKSRQRAFFLLVEAGVTAQNMRDYNRCQSMSLRDTPLLVEADGLKNYEKDAKLAQVYNSLKEKHRAKQMEISISNKLADEAQLTARNTHLQGSSGVPLIPTTIPHVHREDMAGQILRKIQQSKDEGQQRINIVPAPLVGKMKSRLFQGAKDRAALHEMFGRSNFLPPPHSSTDIDGGGTTDDDSDDDDTSAPKGGLPMLPRPSLPPSATLPRPNLPLPPRPPPLMIYTQPRHIFTPNTSLFSQQQHLSGHIALPAPRAAPPRSPTPPRVTEFMRNIAPNQSRQLIEMLNQQANLATNRVRAQESDQSGQASVQSPQSIGNAGLDTSNMMQRASNPSASLGLPPYPRPLIPVAPRAPNMTISAPQLPTQYQLPRGFEGGFNSYAQLQLPPGFEHPRSFSSEHVPPYFGPSLPSQLPAQFQQAQTLSYPNAPGFSGPVPPLALAPRLAAAQEIQGYATSSAEELRNGRTTLPQVPDLPSLNRPVNQIGSNHDRQDPSLNSFLAPPRVTMQRTTPSPLTLRPPASPLSSLAPSLLAASPFTTSHRGIPVQIYLPRILVPANTIGPGGLKLGNNGCAETDVFLLGHTHPKSGKITLNRAVFLPLGVWTNAQDRVRKGRYTVLESYIAPVRTTSVPHRAVYEKARQAYKMMIVGSPAARERELTKRWRASRGRMTATERGAVWEGWAVEIDKEIALSKEERMGTFVQDELIDGIDENSDEVRRRREIEELLDTDEAWDDAEDEDEDEDVHMQG
jgi:hypothetical protein